MKKLLFILIAMFFVSCSDDSGSDGSEYNGFYQMTSSQEKVACQGDWVNKELEFEYVRFKAGSFFGISVIGWTGCLEPTDASCDADDNFLSSGMFIKKDGVWQDYMTYSSYYDSTCNVGKETGYLDKENDIIFWDMINKKGEFTVANQDDCEPELADERENELTCESMEKYSAQKIK